MTDELAEAVEGRIAGALKAADDGDVIPDELHEDMAAELAEVYAERMSNRLSVGTYESLVNGGDGE